MEMAKRLSLINHVKELVKDDYLIVQKNGQVSLIRYEDFIKDIVGKVSDVNTDTQL